ncbi:MAG: DUF3341 domain-containing protein [Candidatus Zixiibacteriota bacterium]
MAIIAPEIKAIIAEFDSPADLMHAGEKVRDAGFISFDCHSPFPIHGMDKAMGLKRSPVGYIVGTAALIGFAAISGFIYWVSAVDYPMVISGKPFFSFQAFVPVVFAVTVLTSAITATFGMLIINKLPQLFHPLFESKNFVRFSDDGFFVSIDAKDSKFDAIRTKDFLKSIGGKNIEVIEVKG